MPSPCRPLPSPLLPRVKRPQRQMPHPSDRGGRASTNLALVRKDKTREDKRRNSFQTRLLPLLTLFLRVALVRRTPVYVCRMCIYLWCPSISLSVPSLKRASLLLLTQTTERLEPHLPPWSPRSHSLLSFSACTQVYVQSRHPLYR